MSIDKEIVQKYSDRHRFWTDKAITQFGNSTNLIFLISIGFIAYLIKEQDLPEVFRIKFDEKISWHLLFYALSILSILFAIAIGCVTVMSRLYDLRLTRHTIMIRKQTYKKWKKEYEDEFVDISNESMLSKFQIFVGTWFKKFYFITDSDMKNFEDLKCKFKALRRRNLIVGQFSWSCLSGQILFLSLGFFFFLIYLFTKL